MKNVFYTTLILILMVGLLTSCGATSEEASPVGTWNLESVNNQPLPLGKKITFEFQADGIVIRKIDGVAVEEKSEWSIKEEGENRFLHITNLENTKIKEKFKIQKLDANILIFLDAQETVTLIRQK